MKYSSLWISPSALIRHVNSEMAPMWSLINSKLPCYVWRLRGINRPFTKYCSCANYNRRTVGNSGGLMIPDVGVNDLEVCWIEEFECPICSDDDVSGKEIKFWVCIQSSCGPKDNNRLSGMNSHKPTRRSISAHRCLYVCRDNIRSQHCFALSSLSSGWSRK